MNQPADVNSKSTVNPTLPIYDSGKLMGKMWWLPITAIIVALAATICILRTALTGPKGASAQSSILMLAALWTVCAPIWFFLEYHFFYRKAPGQGSWELFKHGQQLAIAVWAGIAAALYALSTSDVVKAQTTETSCTIEYVLPAHSSSAPHAATVKCK